VNLSHSISKYAAITRINLQSNLAYVGEFASRSMPIDAVIQLSMTDHAVADINVLDPPLEEIIVRIYTELAEMERKEECAKPFDEFEIKREV
jgi:hypothetical protein